MVLGRVKGSTMIYKIFVSLLLVASFAFATVEKQNSDLLKAKQDSLESKRGLTVDGNIKGVLVNSKVSSDQEEAKLNRMPNGERSQFVLIWDSILGPMNLCAQICCSVLKPVCRTILLLRQKRFRYPG